MAETTDKGAASLEQGYFGAVPDEIENDAYTLQGQGPETAQREREQLQALRASQAADSGEDTSTAGKSASKSSKSSSSTTSGSSSS